MLLPLAQSTRTCDARHVGSPGRQPLQLQWCAIVARGTRQVSGAWCRVRRLPVECLMAGARSNNPHRGTQQRSQNCERHKDGRSADITGDHCSNSRTLCHPSEHRLDVRRGNGLRHGVGAHRRGVNARRRLGARSVVGAHPDAPSLRGAQRTLDLVIAS